MAGSTEAEAVADLIRRAFAQYRDRLTPPATALSVTAEDIAAAMTQGPVLVALVEGVPVGCVTVTGFDDFAYAGRLSVLPDWRGRGIGQALMQAAEEAARGLGRSRLRVETRLANTANRAFYRALGYVEGAERSHPGFTVPTYVQMEKSLI
jgi:ribosomal protein S18 acetylase RimI-like enzyme